MVFRSALGLPRLRGVEEFSDVLRAHHQTHQALEPRDIYKLIYQRVFGPEHSIDHMTAARERLYLEVVRLPEPPASDPLVEPLSPVLCRVNLQPFIQSGGSVAMLWKVFRQTVREFQPGTVVDLQRTWSLFLGTPWAKRYAPECLEQVWQRLATANFPPVHHSRGYVRANAPHYRVVLGSLAAVQLGIPPRL
jgi:hypothetical protein